MGSMMSFHCLDCRQHREKGRLEGFPGRSRPDECLAGREVQRPTPGHQVTKFAHAHAHAHTPLAYTP